jgi:alpha-galactosidase
MSRIRLVVRAALVAVGAIGLSRPATAQGAAALAGILAPANAVWVDSLDLTKAIGRMPRPGQAAIGGRGGRAGQPAAPPTPITLDGTVYQHGLGVTSNGELWIDLGGKAKSFVAVAGIDDARKTGRGSVTFEVWVDGKKRFDSGLLKAGQSAVPVNVDLTGAKQLALFVGDGGDGTTDDVADWGGAAIVMTDASSRPFTMAPPVDPAPTIASSAAAVPWLNNPRITGATPGRPFLFRIPASGEGPLNFAAKDLPAGLVLDAHTGIITGALKQAGRTPVTVTVTGPKGKTTGTITIVGGIHSLALTPPLGWNSWNVWGGAVTDAEVRAAADALVKTGLAAQGYTYVNIDDAWEGPRDANGEITSNANFPDMKALADYIHTKGLKIGIYSGPGPRTCQQKFAASYQHEAQDAKTWARWGFDYIKYDWCSYTDIEPRNGNADLAALQKPYSLLRGVLDSLNRDLVFSLCQYGWGSVWTWGAEQRHLAAERTVCPQDPELALRHHAVDDGGQRAVRRRRWLHQGFVALGQHPLCAVGQRVAMQAPSAALHRHEERRSANPALNHFAGNERKSLQPSPGGVGDYRQPASPGVGIREQRSIGREPRTHCGRGHHGRCCSSANGHPLY